MTPNIHQGHCFTCGTDCGPRHICPEPEVLLPQPPPKPFVKRWDPVAGLWVSCLIENGKAWDFQRRAYTDVKRGELVSGEPER